MLELTNTEQVIMKCIWEIGDNVAVADLLERLKTEYGKEYARTTISVFMSYLRDKGYVTYEKRSHAYVYKPLISEQDYQKELMKRYQKTSFSGSAVADTTGKYGCSQHSRHTDRRRKSHHRKCTDRIGSTDTQHNTDHASNTGDDG